MEKFVEQMIKERNEAVDERLRYLLDKYNLPHDKDELAKLGYLVITETTPLVFDPLDNSNRSSYRYKLCKIQDMISFDVVSKIIIEE